MLYGFVVPFEKSDMIIIIIIFIIINIGFKLIPNVNSVCVCACFHVSVCVFVCVRVCVNGMIMGLICFVLKQSARISTTQCKMRNHGFSDQCILYKPRFAQVTAKLPVSQITDTIDARWVQQQVEFRLIKRFQKEQLIRATYISQVVSRLVC